MNTTIFCTFDHQDLADLAMGHIRTIQGVKTIHYIHGPNSREPHGGPQARAVAGTMGSSAVGWAFTNSDIGYGAASVPHPVTVKISCVDDAKNRVVSRLVNQHASHIIVTPR